MHHRSVFLHHALYTIHIAAMGRLRYGRQISVAALSHHGGIVIFLQFKLACLLVLFVDLLLTPLFPVLGYLK